MHCFETRMYMDESFFGKKMLRNPFENLCFTCSRSSYRLIEVWISELLMRNELIYLGVARGLRFFVATHKGVTDAKEATTSPVPGASLEAVDGGCVIKKHGLYMGVPQNGWFTMEIRLKWMMIWGYPVVNRYLHMVYYGLTILAIQESRIQVIIIWWELMGFVCIHYTSYWPQTRVSEGSTGEAKLPRGLWFQH